MDKYSLVIPIEVSKQLTRHLEREGISYSSHYNWYEYTPTEIELLTRNEFILRDDIKTEDEYKYYPAYTSEEIGKILVLYRKIKDYEIRYDYADGIWCATDKTNGKMVIGVTELEFKTKLLTEIIKSETEEVEQYN